jgi:O-antigen ligase
MPDLFPGAWRGLWVEKNNLGGNMNVGFALCAAAAVLNPVRAKMWAAFAVLCVGLIVLSTSKTSLVVLLLTMGAFAFIALVKRGRASGVAMTWIAVAGLGLMALVLIFASEAVFALLGKDATFTGRTEIWEGVTRVAEMRPLTGYGYGAIWNNDDPYAPLARIVQTAGFKPEHAHNGWMELWLNLGVVGLVAFGLWFAEVWARTIWSIFTSRGAWMTFPILLGYSLAMLTESITLIWHDVRWMLFVMLAVKMAMGEDPPAAAGVRPRR